MFKCVSMMYKFFRKYGIEPLIPILLLRLFLVYFLYSLCRIEFYIFNHGFYNGMTFGHFIGLMIGGFKFDTVAIFYTNLLFIFLHVIPFKFRYHKIYQSVLFYIFVIANTIAIFSNFIDYVYYSFTLKRTTFSVFHEFMHDHNMGTISLNAFVDYWQATLLFIVTIIAMVWLYKRIKVPKPEFPVWWKYYGIGLIFFLISITLFIGGVRGGYKHSTRPITLSNAGDYVSNPREMHIVLNTPFSILKTIGITSLEKHNYFPQDTLEEIYNPVRNPHPTAAFKPKNVVILILESFGKENIGFYNKDLDNGHYKGFTPFLDSLCQHSCMFWNSFANGRKSIEGIPSVLSSIPSVVEPFVLTEYYDDKLPSLAKDLKQKGYYTAFFHGAPNGSMGFSAYTKLIGIDDYYGMNEYGNDADFDGTWGIWDEPFLQFMCRKISTFHQPFMSTVFTVSSHHPFNLPDKYKGKFPEGHETYTTHIWLYRYGFKRIF